MATRSNPPGSSRGYTSLTGLWFALNILSSIVTAQSAPQCRWEPNSILKARHDAKCTGIIDDTSSDFAPWAYQPHCVYPKEDNSSSVKFCIFTYISEDETAGVSLVAAPETAAFATGILASHPGPWGGPPSFHLTHGDKKKAYEVKEIPGKGKGVIARRKIPADETIISEFPHLIGFTSGPKGIAREKNPGLLHRAVNRLPPSHHEQIDSLSRTTGGEPLEDIMRTNAYGVNIGGTELSAVFPEIARLNHACRPNAFTRFSRTTLQMEIITHREIQEGEEITVSYIPQNMMSHQRKKLLSRRGFNCTCEVCSSPQEEAKSDRNKQRVQDIILTFRDLEKRTVDIIGNLSTELFDILYTESLQAQVGEFCALFADLYWEIGEKEKARHMARTSVDRRVWYSGTDSERAEKAHVFLEKFQG